MANLHLIIGEDDFLVARAAQRLIGDVGGGLEVIDSATATNIELQLADIHEADASFSTPPFLEPVKVTWWRNVHFLPQSGKAACSEDVKKALEKFAVKLAKVNLPENQRFILSGSRLLMTSEFAKTLKPVAEIIAFSAGKPWEVEKRAVASAIEFAKEAGISFAPDVVERFVEVVGTDTRSLCSEVGKLRDYLEPGVTVALAADVAAITSQGVGVEPAIWSITDAVGARDVAAAIAAVSRFEREKGFAVMVTSTLERFFRQLCELKDAEARGHSQTAATGMTPYALRKNLGFVGRWSLRDLRTARYRFMRLRERVVSSSGAFDPLVVTEVVRACLPNVAD